MKAIKIDNQFQLIQDIPESLKRYPVYSVIKPSIRPNQKYDNINNSEVDDDLKVITFNVIDMTNEEYNAVLSAEVPKLVEDLKDIVFDLESGAKRIAIGKEGSENYIASQERLYFHKYKIAKGELPDVNDLLLNEAQEVGISLEAYKTLIIQKYEQGQAMFDTFLSMIERARIKVLYFLDNLQNHKAKEVMELMSSVKSTMPMNEIQQTMHIILNYK